MGKYQQRLIALATVKVWTSVFSNNINRPALLSEQDRKIMITEFIQLSKKEEEGFWKIYNKLQGKSDSLSAERLELMNSIPNTVEQSEERAAVVADVLLEWISASIKLFERQMKKMKSAIGKKKTKAFLIIEFNFYVAQWKI